MFVSTLTLVHNLFTTELPPIGKPCLIVATLLGQIWLSGMTADACPGTAGRTSSVSATMISATRVVTSATTVHVAQVPEVEPLPPGAKIVSSRILTPEEVAANRKPTDRKQAAPAASKSSKSQDQEAKASSESLTIAKTKDVVKIDVVDLQTDEEIEVDVRFAEDVVGTAILTAGDFETELTITDWKPNAICLRMPVLGILKPMNVSISLYRPDGHLIRKFDARLIRRETIRRVERANLLTTAMASGVVENH